MMIADDPVPLWRLEVTVPQAAVLAFEELLSGNCVAVSSFGDDGTEWRVEGYTDREPDEATLNEGLAITAAVFDLPTPALKVEFLTPRDWLADNLSSFEPIHVAGFFIYPSHFEGAHPPAATPLQIDAGTAFGSGTHPTTATCLIAMAELAKRRNVGRILDLGCGSGILAFAAASLWSARIIATDIDPEAVRVAARNANINHLRHKVTAICSNGFRHHMIRRNAPFDLIVANVLARPLMGMARDTIAALIPGGHVILSGLMTRDAPWVVAKYGARGLVLSDQWSQDGWTTLMMRKPNKLT